MKMKVSSLAQEPFKDLRHLCLMAKNEYGCTRLPVPDLPDLNEFGHVNFFSSP